MKTKEEVIKDSWLKYGIPYGDYIDENGYISLSKNLDSIVYEVLLNVQYEQNDLKNQFARIDGNYRPKSLTGIETNNGWIRIESEEDLPKEDLLYWVKNNYNEIHTCEFDTDYKAFRGYFAEEVDGKVTHYQPIIKPLPPLY